MGSTVTRFVVVACALALACDALAQDRVFVRGGVAQLPYTEEIAADDGFGASLAPISPLVHQPLIGGGRYAVSATTSCDLTPCVAVDWQGVAHPLPYAFVSVVATDPVRPRVFVQTAAGAVDAVDVDTGFVTSMFPAAASVSGSCRYAFSAARLFCLEASAAPSLHVFSTGGAPGEAPQVVGTVASVPFGTPPWLVTPDGTRVFAGERSTDAALLVLTYVATGTRVTVPLPAVTDLVWDDFNARVLVAPAPNIGHAFTQDLAYLGSASFAFTATAIAVSAATGRLYARGLDAQSAGYGDAYTAAFDSRTYGRLTSITHSQGFGGAPRVTVLSPPGVPRDVASAVQGRTVTLTWTNVGAASGFLLEVRGTPGGTAFAVPLSWSSHATFTGVPSGTYDVRLRGVNAFGVGQASAGVRVVVP